MRDPLVRTLRVGLIAALALVIASDLPVLGSIINLPGLNWLIWIGVWAWLADQFVRDARPRLALSDNPSITAMGAGAVVGLVSGLAGQLIQILIQSVLLAMFENRAAQSGSSSAAQGTGAAFSLLGSIVAAYVYPAFGAFWGGLFG